MVGPVRRLHVVHVLHSLDVGGTENGVVNLMTALDEGFRHTVIAMTSVGRTAARLPAGVTTIALGKRVGIDLHALTRLAALLRRLKPDIVHSRNWGAFDAVLAGRLAGAPVIVHGEHGREASDPWGLNGWRNRLRRCSAPLVNRFVTVSCDLRRWLVETVGIPATKVETIHNGVDVNRFSEEARDAGRRALGLPPGVTVIGTVGRLDPVKDQLGLIEAFARLDHRGRTLALVIVGEGPCRTSLETRAQQPDVAGRVHLFGERSDVPLLLKGVDIFALPSIAEGISNTVLEAMATGLPVVATRTGGNPEVVEDGVTGALVPVGDRQALARALEAYVADPYLMTTHGKAGRQRATQEFGLERMAGCYRHLYLDLARGSFR